MQAIENEPAEPGSETAAIGRYRQQGRLKTFTPAPLGEERERFLALVRDMRRRGDAYTSQLSMLTLAGLNRRHQPESHHSILSTLLQGSAIKNPKEPEMLLWQSRLIVKLGEFYDLEQADLRRSLDALERRQNSLLAELCDEEDNPFVLTPSPWESGRETDGILRHRLKAWTRLCFHDGRPAPGILVTRHQTATDLLQEVYEKREGKSARFLARLEIPATACDPETPIDAPLILRCPSLGTLLANVAASGSSLLLTGENERLLQAGISEWSDCTAGMISLPREERFVLELLFFPRISASRLFGESFEGAVAGGHTETEVDGGCVVGLVSRD